MSEKSDHTWYVDTCGHGEANECLFNMFLGAGEEYQCLGKLCEDGIRRSLCECPDHEFLARFERQAKLRSYPYGVYVKEGKYGKIRLRSFNK